MNPSAHFLSTLSPKKDELMLGAHVWSTCAIASQGEYSVLYLLSAAGVLCCAALLDWYMYYHIPWTILLPCRSHITHQIGPHGQKKAALLSRPGRANPSKAYIHYGGWGRNPESAVCSRQLYCFSGTVIWTNSSSSPLVEGCGPRYAKRTDAGTIPTEEAHMEEHPLLGLIYHSTIQ